MSNPKIIEQSGGNFSSKVELRDVFAGQAVQSMILADLLGCILAARLGQPVPEQEAEEMAQAAYCVADAMLEARDTK